MNPERARAIAKLMNEKVTTENIHRLYNEAEKRNPSLDGLIATNDEPPTLKKGEAK